MGSVEAIMWGQIIGFHISLILLGVYFWWDTKRMKNELAMRGQKQKEIRGE